MTMICKPRKQSLMLEIQRITRKTRMAMKVVTSNSCISDQQLDRCNKGWYYFIKQCIYMLKKKKNSTLYYKYFTVTVLILWCMLAGADWNHWQVQIRGEENGTSVNLLGNIRLTFLTCTWQGWQVRRRACTWCARCRQNSKPSRPHQKFRNPEP